MYRTVELTCKASDLAEVLSKLKSTEKFKENAAFTLQVDIEDEKENYEYLCKSGKVLNWDFVKTQEEENKRECDKSSCLDQSCQHSKKFGGDRRSINIPYKDQSIEEAVSVVSGELEEGRVYKILQESLGEDITTTDLSNILVSVWTTIGKNSQASNIKFSSLFFKEIVIPYVLSRREDPDNTIIGMTVFIETFYNATKVEKDVMLKDFIKRIRLCWDNIKELDNFPGISGILFAPDKNLINKVFGYVK